MNEVPRHFCWHQNFVPWRLSAPALGLYICIKSWKKCIKSDVKVIFLNLQQMTEVTSKFRPQGVVRHCPGAIYMYKIVKKCIKSDFKEIIFKLVANDRSDKRFLLTSKFRPLGLSVPDLRLYTFMKSWNDVYKLRGWRDFFKTCNKWPSFWHQNFGPDSLFAPTLGLCLSFFSSITADYNIFSALMWAIQANGPLV